MNRFLRCFCVSVAAIFLLGTLINYALDPLGYFRNHGWHDGTFVGDRVWADDRLAFDLSIDAYRPDTLIVGNSRVAHGFAINDDQLPARLGTTLKLGVRGAQYDELDRYIRQILNNHTVKNLVIGLDLGQFLRGRDRFVRSEQRSQLDSGGFLPAHAKKLMVALWSRNAFLASATSLMSQNMATLDGSSNAEVMLERLDGVGHRELTRRVEERIASGHPIFDSQIYTERLTALDALLADACTKSITVRLFISPIHVRQLLIMQNTGLLNRFFAWKVQLANILEKHRTARCRVTLTDFSGISRYTSEPFPEPGDRHYRMRWYWESSHYTHKLGRMIIERLWNEGDSPDEFGKNLTSESIAGWLDDERNRLNALIREQPVLVQEIGDLDR